ncbi:MAG: hypothetical protein KME10_23905, partial [Plectolyngbya sp. WJT66-NPBG17]|nr:hypothetical protein [Plectolyngbya sp. WJT66-NPBG17]MBW4528121.1 hypothetical protein [Phormidium tanganyikae FI6-MK23]
VGSTGEAGECQSDAQVALCLSQCNLSSLSLLHIWVAPLSKLEVWHEQLLDPIWEASQQDGQSVLDCVLPNSVDRFLQSAKLVDTQLLFQLDEF